MKIGRLLVRLVVGGLFIGHGTQKLFGWFGGYGPDATGQFFESLGLRPGRRNAMAAGCTGGSSRRSMRTGSNNGIGRCWADGRIRASS